MSADSTTNSRAPVTSEPGVGKGKTVMVLMIMAALSLVVFYNYLLSVKENAKENRPGRLGRIEKSVTLTEKGGREVSISELQGRVIVAGLVAPEASETVGFLKSVQSRFGKDGRLHLLSLAVEPETQTSDTLKTWAEKHGIEGENWWVTTGEKKIVHGFAKQELGLRGVKETDGKVEAYDRRLVLVDEKGQVRGYYDVANPDPDLSDEAKVRFQKELSWVMNQGIPISSMSAERGISLLERSGETVDTSSLSGKLRLVAYVYTRCPNGCAGVVEFMKGIQSEFGSDPRLHLMSVSLDPEYDTPEIMSEWAKTHEVSGENWWFLTGDKEEIRRYMMEDLGFLETQVKPPSERLTEADIYAHDMRIALIDTGDRVRTFYDVMNLDPGTAERAQERLQQDVRTLLEEEAPDSAP